MRYNYNNKNTNKAWAPLPEKPVKANAPKSRKAAFMDKVENTAKYYSGVSFPTLPNNMQYTSNGAVAYKSTGSALLDINTSITALRSLPDGDIVKKFRAAYCENPRLAIRWLWYLRDVREGQGERRSFRVIIKDMALNGGDKIINNLIPMFGEYGRYDDLFVLFGTPCEKTMLTFVKKQLKEDYSNLKKIKKNA